MNSFVLGLASLFVLASTTASLAIELPVSYLVDARTLKSQAPAGTDLTFTLYSDSACTSSVFAATVDIDSVSFSIEQLKLAAVKGSEKPPKPLRINAVLTGVTPASPLYLVVTGTGIAAVNGACQIQASGLAGANGPTGPTGATGPTGPSGIGACYRVQGASQAVVNVAGAPATANADCGSDMVLAGGCIGTEGVMLASSEAVGPNDWECRFTRVYISAPAGTVSAEALCCEP